MTNHWKKFPHSNEKFFTFFSCDSFLKKQEKNYTQNNNETSLRLFCYCSCILWEHFSCWNHQSFFISLITIMCGLKYIFLFVVTTDFFLLFFLFSENDENVFRRKDLKLLLEKWKVQVVQDYSYFSLLNKRLCGRFSKNKSFLITSYEVKKNYIL